jgi:hypothetical protein
VKPELTAPLDVFAGLTELVELPEDEAEAEDVFEAVVAEEGVFACAPAR